MTRYHTYAVIISSFIQQREYTRAELYGNKSFVNRNGLWRFISHVVPALTRIIRVTLQTYEMTNIDKEQNVIVTLNVLHTRTVDITYYFVNSFAIIVWFWIFL